MKLAILFKSKLGLFIIQILILTLLIWLFQYEFFIEFDTGILSERQFVIQLLANYVMYEFNTSMLFQHIIWIFVALIPVLTLIEVRRTILMNLITFFFPNFFFYVFLSRYSPIYFNNFIVSLFVRTLILGLVIILFSSLSAILLKSIKKLKKEDRELDISLIEQQVKSKCPYCGTEFNSNPIFCYKCNRQLIPDYGDMNEHKE